MYETVKEKIEEIIEITKKCPESLQVKCFELLITPLLNNAPAPVNTAAKMDGKSIDSLQKPMEFIIPIDVRAFLQQYAVPEEKLSKLFLMQGSDVISKYSLTTTKKARGQIQLATLSALENAIKGKKFQFSIPDVKQKCIDHKTYDLRNFQGIFKKNDSLFKSLTDQENVELSPDGKQRLAEEILELAK